MTDIYCDGACLGNPGVGGWGFAIYEEGKLIDEKSGAEENTTNNRMELLAALCALDYAALLQSYKTNKETSNDSPLTVFTDSQYVQKGLEEWLPNWIKNNWRGSKGPIKNQDLWQQLHQANNCVSVQWKWVKGHSGVEGNEKADILATTAAQELKKKIAQKQEKQEKQEKRNEEKERCYLNVPFSQKDDVKKMGARWDPDKRKWYCMERKKESFKKWIE